MKQTLVLAFFILTFQSIGVAQEFRANGYTFYVFDDQFETFNNDVSFYNGTIEGGLLWGVGLEYKAHPYAGVEILYMRQDTEVPVNYYRGLLVSRTLDAAVNYIMLGGNGYFYSNERVEAFGGLMAGAVVYSNKEPLPDEPGSISKFAWGFRLGGNIWATEKFGIKVQTQLLSAVQAWGGSFYLGTGGSGAGVSTFSTIWQFGLGGGLTVRFGGNGTDE